MPTPARRFRWTAWAVLLLLPLLALGCMRATSQHVMADHYGGAHAPPRDAPADYGGFEADGEAGVVATASYGSTQTETKARASANRREFARESRPVPAAAAPPVEEAPGIDADTSVDVAQSEPSPEPNPEPVQQAASKRQIIYTATMQVSVHDVEHAVATAEALPDALGGWLHQRSDNQLVLRIPAAQLELAMDTIAELGVVDQRVLQALDVTAQYTDLESRIRVLEEMQRQLAALLAEAKSVEQALEIRTALDQITLELELARAQMRELSKSVAFSTLIVRFVERGPVVAIPSRNDPFTWVDELGVEQTEYR